MERDFLSLAAAILAPALTEHGFTLVETRGRHTVVFDSTRLRASFTYDPRGELDVDVYLIGTQHWEGWTYCGMVGRAPLERLLELALIEMFADPRTLSGDASYYEHLAVENAARRAELTAYYSGNGPKPGRRRPLP